MKITKKSKKREIKPKIQRISKVHAQCLGGDGKLDKVIRCLDKVNIFLFYRWQIKAL